MRIAVTSDIHSNFEAYKEVIKVIEKNKVDEIVNLGDVIGYGPDFNECVEAARKNNLFSLCGNHETYLLDMEFTKLFINTNLVRTLEFAKNNLEKRNLEYLSNCKLTAKYENCYFVHSSPFEPKKWHYISTREFAKTAFEALEERICFFGHSHIPAIFSKDIDGQVSMENFAGKHFLDEKMKYLINPGSIGQPRNHDNYSSFLIYDNEENYVEFFRVKYNINVTLKKIVKLGFPEKYGLRLYKGV